VLVGAIAAIAAVRLGSPPAVALLVGAAGFTIAITLHAWYVRRGVARLMADHHPMFPTPEGE
jgi:xanthosine utilization system XapX-like protein